MANAGVTVKGISDMRRKIEEAKQRLLNAAAGAAYLEGCNIMTLAKEYTPVDTGALKNSGFVTLPVIEKSEVTCEIGFGGPATSYALKVHETHRTMAKFLERAIDESKPTSASNMQAFAKQIFDGTGRAPTKQSGMPAGPYDVQVGNALKMQKVAKKKADKEARAAAKKLRKERIKSFKKKAKGFAKSIKKKLKKTFGKNKRRRKK